jgi:diacylglycerol kinase family enzyme
MFRAAEVQISCERPFTMYADGDPIGRLPLRVRALKGAVRILVPPAGGEHRAFSDESAAGGGAPSGEPS